MTPSIPLGGSTGLCHEHTASIDIAVATLIETPLCQRGPAIAELRNHFGRTMHDACPACHEAHLAKARAA